MKLFFDLDSDRIVTDLGSKTPLPQAEHKRGSGSGITLVLLRDGAPWQAPALGQMVVCVKPFGKYEPEDTLAFTSTWTFDTSRTEYVGDINYITTNLDNILQISGAVPNQSTTLRDLVVEMAYRPSDSSPWTHRSQALPFILHNNYYRGTETVPPADPSEEGSILPYGVWQQTVLYNAINTTSASYADVTGLSFPVEAGKTYRFNFMIPFITGADIQGSGWSINGPAASFLRYTCQQTLDVDSVSHNVASAYNLPASANASSLAAGSMAIIEGLITPSAGGTVIARVRCETGGHSVTAQVGSNVQFMVLPPAV